MIKIKAHDFEVDGGNIIENGKSHWPDCLNIKLSKYQALKLIQQLAAGLEYYQNQEFIPLNFMGKLDYDVEKDL